MVSTIEAQTAEEGKGLSMAESCDRKPVKNLHIPFQEASTCKKPPKLLRLELSKYRPVAAPNHYRMNIVTVAQVCYTIITFFWSPFWWPANF